jgi:hypothetical protein
MLLVQLSVHARLLSTEKQRRTVVNALSLLLGAK